MMAGYRNVPEKTSEALDADSWLHTGDIAQIDEEGYISHRRPQEGTDHLLRPARTCRPPTIESTLKAECTLVGSVVAIGDRRPYNVALMTTLILDARGALLDDESVLAELEPASPQRATGASRKDQALQDPARRVVEAGGDELTPTMKLKRKPIAEKYSAEIDELYNP